MSEHFWGWVIWSLSLPVLLLLAVISFGFTLAFIPIWWMGGPFYLSKDGDVAPFWQPMKPCKLWWRDVR